MEELMNVKRWLMTWVAGALLMLGCSGGAPGEAASAEVLERLGESYYLVHGDSSFQVYAFRDPHCPACSDLVEAVEDGATPNVEWRWVPVGFLGERSREDAAAQIEQEHDVDGEQAVAKNMEIAQALGVRSVPTVFYQDPEGQVRYFVGGEQQALEALDRMAADEDEGD